MEEFQIKYFSERLKKTAKEKYGTINKLAEALEMKPSEISNYTKTKKPREPRAEFLYKLRYIGWDINSLLDVEGNTMGVKDKQEKYSAEYLELKAEIKKLNTKVEHLENENKILKNLLALLLKENISLEMKNLVLSVLDEKIENPNSAAVESPP